MENLKRIHATEDLLGGALSEIARLKQALRDIATAEPIPSYFGAFNFCRDVAAQALKE
jgi:hypothetical protein